VEILFKLNRHTNSAVVVNVMSGKQRNCRNQSPLSVRESLSFYYGFLFFDWPDRDLVVPAQVSLLFRRHLELWRRNEKNLEFTGRSSEVLASIPKHVY